MHNDHPAGPGARTGNFPGATVIDIAGLLQALPARVNAEPNLLRIGRFCTTEFLLDAGEQPFHVAVDRGRLADVMPGPFRMRAWCFALRAAPQTWARFWEPLPAPGFNDIFAMARYGHLLIEGDVGPLLRDLRYVKEVLALPRRMLSEEGR